MNECETIIDEWEKELREDVNNYLSKDELCLWTRMKYDNFGNVLQALILALNHNPIII